MMNKNFERFMEQQFAENTCITYSKHINSFLDYCGKQDEDITTADVNEWLSSLSKSGATKALALNSLRTYFKYLVSFGFIEENPCDKALKPRVTSKPKHYMDVEMVRSMIDSATSYRDKAIILLFATSGMRVSELTGLTISDYKNMKTNNSCEIEIQSKREKRRFIYINKQCQDLIDVYLKSRKTNCCDKLFVTNQGNEIARNNLSLMLKKVAKRANISFWEDVSNHQLRSACATIYLENGMTLPELKELLGHESISTTLLYTKANRDNVSKKVKSMEII